MEGDASVAGFSTVVCFQLSFGSCFDTVVVSLHSTSQYPRHLRLCRQHFANSATQLQEICKPQRPTLKLTVVTRNGSRYTNVC